MAVEPVAAEEDSKAVVVVVDNMEPAVVAAEGNKVAVVAVDPAVADNKAAAVVDMGLVLDAEPDNSRYLPTL